MFAYFSALYRVSVETADGLLTGTDANVFIQIFGKLGNTSVVRLTKSGNLFESGQLVSLASLSVGLVRGIKPPLALR